MKIRRATINQRKAQLEFVTYSGQIYPLPFSRLSPTPTAHNKVVTLAVDPELAREAATYTLQSGDEGTVHIEQVLDYNQDPSYMAEILVHKLTVEAQHRVNDAGLSRRELARRLQTSLPQLYRLLDPTNTSKSLTQLVALLHALGCEVDLVIKPRAA